LDLSEFKDDWMGEDKICTIEKKQNEEKADNRMFKQLIVATDKGKIKAKLLIITGANIHVINSKLFKFQSKGDRDLIQAAGSKMPNVEKVIK
jgi:hypothetical protein